jgi:polyhydroxyalkanoate synthesis regulator phasin
MEDRAQRNDVVRDTLRKASKVVDTPLRRTEEAVRKIAERPNIDLMDAPHLAWEFIQKGRQQAEKAKDAIDAQLRKRLEEMGVATKVEVDGLKRRISELEAAARSAGRAPEHAEERAGTAAAGAPATEAATAPAPVRPRPVPGPKAATARPKAITPRPTRARSKPTGPTGPSAPSGPTGTGTVPGTGTTLPGES